MRTRTIALFAAPVLATVVAVLLTSARPPAAQGDEAGALAAFEKVRRVLQHPRCVNCHIPGDAPLQFDDSRVHAQNVKRGKDGKGSPGLSCATCHFAQNAPASYGPNMPPGAPNWHLPPEHMKMVFLGKTPAELARVLKDPAQTNGKDLKAMLEHVTHDKLVLWGWEPGVGRAAPPVPHAEFVAAFKAWVDAGAPVPAEGK